MTFHIFFYDISFVVIETLLCFTTRKTGSTKHFCGESIQLLYFICDIDIKYLHCNSAIR